MSYLDSDGACPADGPLLLTIGQMVYHLKSPPPPTPTPYELVLVELFDALRTAFQTATADDSKDGWTPTSSRNRRHSPSSGGNARRLDRNPRGSHHKRNNSDNSSSSTAGRPRTRNHQDPPTSVSFGPRQVTPRLEDVSRTILGLSDSDESDRPLSSVVARNLAATSQRKQYTQSSAHTHTAASARVAAIQREYIQMDVKKLWHVKTMPAADNEDSGEFTTALITSIRRTVRNILEIADATGTQRFEDSDWVDGWQTPLHKAMHRAINRRSLDTAASPPQVLDSFFSAMDADRAPGAGGPTLLPHLKRRVTSYFDHTTQGLTSAVHQLLQQPTTGASSAHNVGPRMNLGRSTFILGYWSFSYSRS